MKKVIVLVLIIRSLMAGAQVQSDCTVPVQLTDVYRKDIVQLATNYLFQVQSPDTIFVHPQQQTVDEISGGLAAILNATSIPERDSVFNLYCVHNLNGWPYEYAGFLVQVDTTYAWTQAWQNLVTVTGNAYLDSLTSMYALHVVNFYNWSFGNYAELTVDSAWNILALMDSISYAPGVISVEQNGIFGLAGRIDYTKTGSDRYYDFYFEFNDCFDGCDNYHRWSFKVDSACTVTYLGFLDWGVFGIAPLPLPENCNLFTSLPDNLIEKELFFYPNPVQDRLHLELPAHTPGISAAGTISIYNMLGVLQPCLVSAGRETTVDVTGLVPGIYWLVFNKGQTSFRGRFIKN